MAFQWHPSIAGVILTLAHLMFCVISTVFNFWHCPLRSTSSSLVLLAALSKASTQILSIDLLLILVSVCCDLAQYMRDKLAISHKHKARVFDFRNLLYWCFIPYSLLHVILSWTTLALANKRSSSGILTYLQANFGTVSGLSGHLLLVLLLVLILHPHGKPRAYRQPTLSYGITVFVLFGSLHVAFYGSGQFQTTNTTALAWLCSLGGIALYNLQVAYREGKHSARHPVSALKTIEHPGQIVEVRMSKAHVQPKIGQVGLQTFRRRWADKR